MVDFSLFDKALKTTWVRRCVPKIVDHGIYPIILTFERRRKVSFSM